jgi:hypothetical protein
MPEISDHLLTDIAARVARRMATGPAAPERVPGRYTVLALSGEGRGLDAALEALAASGEPAVAVADCATSSTGAIATALARVRSLRALTGEASYDAVALVAGAVRVLAPAMDLALASRVASMQADTPAARTILRALLAGVRVDATLAEREFAVSASAPDGARRALDDVVARLRDLGVHVSDGAPKAVAARAGVPAGPHPSQERFGFPEPLGEFVEFLEGRPCSIETDKPCVGCGACEARGF